MNEGATPITWLDLLTVVIFVCVGISLWQVSGVAAEYFLLGMAPAKEEFLNASTIRSKESQVKTTRAEVDLTRARLAEQRLAGMNPPANFEGAMTALDQNIARQQATLTARKGEPNPALESALKTERAQMEVLRARQVEQNVATAFPRPSPAERLTQLETALTKEEGELRDLTRTAADDFERAGQRFKLLKRALAAALAIILTAIAFPFVRVIVRRAVRALHLDPNWRRVAAISWTILFAVYAYELLGPGGSAGIALLSFALNLKS